MLCGQHGQPCCIAYVHCLQWNVRTSRKTFNSFHDAVPSSCQCWTHVYNCCKGHSRMKKYCLPAILFRHYQFRNTRREIKKSSCYAMLDLYKISCYCSQGGKRIHWKASDLCLRFHLEFLFARPMPSFGPHAVSTGHSTWQVAYKSLCSQSNFHWIEMSFYSISLVVFYCITYCDGYLEMPPPLPGTNTYQLRMPGVVPERVNLFY